MIIVLCPMTSARHLTATKGTANQLGHYTIYEHTYARARAHQCRRHSSIYIYFDVCVLTKTPLTFLKRPFTECVRHRISTANWTALRLFHLITCCFSTNNTSTTKGPPVSFSQRPIHTPNRASKSLGFCTSSRFVIISAALTGRRNL